MNTCRLFLFSITLFASSCSTDKHSKGESVKIIEFSPYDAVVADIKSLSQIGSRNVWLAYEMSQSKIVTSSDLDKALKYFGASDNKQKNIDWRQNLLKRLEFPHSAYRFGFDGDFSVMVFFDKDGRQTYIYPEGMADNTD